MDGLYSEIHCGEACRKVVKHMRQTYPEAVFDFIDTKAQKDSTASSDTVQPFCDLALLKNEDNSPVMGHWS